MIRFISAIFTFCLLIGVGEAFVKMAYQMASKAEYAFTHNQLSYAEFTRAMTEAKPRTARKPKHATPNR